MRDDLVAIGAFARAARLSIKALRHYHRLGLLVPAEVDDATGYRCYRWEQLGDAVAIATLRQAGIALEPIRDHLVDGASLAELVTAERKRLREELIRAERGLAVLDSLDGAARLPDGEVEELQVDAQQTLTLPGTAPRSTDLDRAVAATIADLLDRAGHLGVRDTTATVTGQYPIDLQEPVRYRVHLPLDQVLPDLPAAWRGALHGGRFLRSAHLGPHATLPLTYRSLLITAGPRTGTATQVRERYLDDPATTPAAALRTEVLLPLRPR